MLCLSKKTEYALTALGYLAQQPGKVASAREIAENQRLPIALLMNILKNLQSHHLLQSTRGVKGGYRLTHELNSLSLFDFVAIVECSPAAAGGNNECGCLEHAQSSANDLSPSENAPIHALKLKLVRFLKEVSITDLITPGRRIDVPFEHVTIQNLSQRRHPHAHYVK